jgi:hypothetical protein
VTEWLGQFWLTHSLTVLGNSAFLPNVSKFYSSIKELFSDVSTVFTLTQSQGGNIHFISQPNNVDNSLGLLKNSPSYRWCVVGEFVMLLNQFYSIFRLYARLLETKCNEIKLYFISPIQHVIKIQWLIWVCTFN